MQAVIISFPLTNHAESLPNVFDVRRALATKRKVAALPAATATILACFAYRVVYFFELGLAAPADKLMQDTMLSHAKSDLSRAGGSGRHEC